jgi:capsular polysaccharide transport system permease protein
MTAKIKVSRFRIRRPADDAPPPAAAPAAQPPADAAASPGPPEDMPFMSGMEDGFGDGPFPTARGEGPPPKPEAPPAPEPAPEPAPDPAAEAENAAIRAEGLTTRQLRLAKRMAQMHGLNAATPIDAVRLLRKAGHDPFQRNAIVDLVTAEPAPPGRALAPVPEAGAPRMPAAPRGAEAELMGEIFRVQRDLVRRRRRKSLLLAVRLMFFVGLPTFLCGWYYYAVATPLYETQTEMVIQQSANPVAGGQGGLGGLLRGSPMETQLDSITVQGYLQSREAMQRLDGDHDFRAHFSDPAIDPIQRLPEGATEEETYRTYARNIRISYDPTEGIIKMAVAATDPATSAEFARALIGYAEGQVDQLTQRLRGNQMDDARAAYEDAEREVVEAQRRLVELQEQFKVMSSEAEMQLVTSQIAQLESQLTTEKLSLAQMEANETPNVARMEPVKRRIATLEAEIAIARARLTESTTQGQSLARVQSELLIAQADVQTRQMLLSQSLASMEAARIEANRQVRYLSVSVSPVPPDEPTYPRAFENTLVAGLIFAGIYLLISMTVAILREQVTA